MKKNSDWQKQIKVLYIVIVLLTISLVGSIIFFSYRINKLNDEFSIGNNLSIFTANKLNDVVHLNKLDTNQCKYLINSREWDNLLSNNTGGLEIVIPEKWSIDKTEIYKCSNQEDSDAKYEFTIYLNIGGNITFNDFTTMIYQKISSIGEVESFNKEKGGYYKINSFEEASYNNMYYEYFTGYSEEGLETSTKTKIKIENFEDNQVKIEINKF